MEFLSVPRTRVLGCLEAWWVGIPLKCEVGVLRRKLLFLFSASPDLLAMRCSVVCLVARSPCASSCFLLVRFLFFKQS